MMIRNVRDKLTSRRCNEDLIGQELDCCKRKPDQASMEKRNAIANEIASLKNLMSCKVMNVVATAT
jgi:hypothetical protein